MDTLGSYSVTVTNSCDSATASIEVVMPEETDRMIPNAFTPDGDGANDVFLPLYDCPAVSDYEFRIYNRWGKEVFSSTVPTDAWDGQGWKANPVPPTCTCTWCVTEASTTWR